MSLESQIIASGLAPQFARFKATLNKVLEKRRNESAMGFMRLGATVNSSFYDVKLIPDQTDINNAFLELNIKLSEMPGKKWWQILETDDDVRFLNALKSMRNNAVKSVGHIAVKKPKSEAHPTSSELVTEYMKYSNGLTTLVHKAITKCGGESTPEIWNPLYQAIEDIFERQVKEYYKMDESSLVKFFVEDDRFIPGTHPKSYYVISDEKRTIGVLWFKHVFGGWRLKFEGDTDVVNWESRGVIADKAKFETEIKAYWMGKEKEKNVVV